MSTAQEIELKIAAYKRVIAFEVEEFDRCVTTPLVKTNMIFLLGRECGGRRARKLRGRGEDVRYSGRTSTGKARYRWMRRAPEIEWRA